MRTRSCLAVILAPLSLSLFSPSAWSATTASVAAFDNATVQTSGPRSGTSGKNYFNVEGANNGTFADFGVIDFDVASFGIGAGTVSSLNSVTLSLTESNSSFTAPGSLTFYVTTDTASDIQPGTSPLANDSTTPPGGTAFNSTLLLLGTGTFNTTGNTNTGNVDTYTFTPATMSVDTGNYLVNLLNSGTGNLRLVATIDDAGAATFAGYSNSTYSGPQLSFDYEVSAAPEPSRALLMMGGVLAVMMRRRKLRPAA